MHGYIKIIWLPLLIGFIIGGIIDYFIPSVYISKILAKKKKITIVHSVPLGFLMSACSHGILAIAMQLYKKGASASATIAFLLASPWANFPVTILLFGLFGLKAFYIIVAAIIVALITGFIYQIFEKKKIIEKSKYTVKVDKKFSVKKDMQKRWKHFAFNSKSFSKIFLGISRGTWSLINMILWWILIGTTLASLVGAFIPTGFMEKYMGASLLGLFITLVVATIIEICSEGSAPLALEIYNKTGAFGNSYVFLSAGVVTDITEIGLIWTNIGRRAALLLPVVTVPIVLVLGFLFNLLV